MVDDQCYDAIALTVAVPDVCGGRPTMPANDTVLKSGKGIFKFGKLGRGGRLPGKGIRPVLK